MTLRLFIALWPNDAVRQHLAGLPVAGGQRVAPANLHMTLAFLGEQPASAVPALHALLLTLPRRSFELRIDRFGHFIAFGKAILWAGPATPPPALETLQRELMAGLNVCGVGVGNDALRFIPHITLARRAPVTAGSTARLEAPIVWSPDAPVLVHSQSTANGLQYRLLLPNETP